MGDPAMPSPSDPVIEAELVGPVPRQFSLATLLGLLTFFAVLLGMLRMLEAPPAIMVLLALWVLVIAVGQALLFRGQHPRLAASVAGMGFFGVGYLIALGVACYEGAPMEFVLSQAIVSLPFTLPIAALFGYLTGLAVAGVFWVCERFRTGRWYETRRGPAPWEAFHRLLPTLYTERLWLRPFEQGDVAQLQPLIEDAAVAATATLLPQRYAGEWLPSWIATHELNARYGQEMVLAILRREEGQLLGAIRLRFSARQRHGELDGWIGRPFWNQGYATEAARVVIRYALKQLSVQEIFARPLLRNPAAARVLVKLGLQAGEVLPQGLEKNGVREDCQRYTISRSVTSSSTSPKPDSPPSR